MLGLPGGLGFEGFLSPDSKVSKPGLQALRCSGSSRNEDLSLFIKVSKPGVKAKACLRHHSTAR